MTQPSSDQKRIALVTGANKGIGYEIARQLGRDHGMTVLIGARDEGRGREAAEKLTAEGIDARHLALEVTDPASVAAAAAQIESDFGKLDVLVNNAGVFFDYATASEADFDKFEATHKTNSFGPFVTTKTFLPLLKKSSAGRIVNVSSSLGSLALNSDPNWGTPERNFIAYNSSKAALNMQTVMFANELKSQGSPIKVNAVCPGYVATDLNNHQGHRTVEQGAGEPVRLATLPEDGPSGGYFDENGPIKW